MLLVVRLQLEAGENSTQATIQTMYFISTMKLHLVTAKNPQNSKIRQATVSKYPAWLFCAAGQQQKFFLWL